MKYITVGDEKTKGHAAKGARPKLNPTYWNYSDVPLDKKNWCINPKYRPVPYDLCELQVEDHEKPMNGWWTGIEWYALKKKKKEKVLKWRSNREFTI